MNWLVKMCKESDIFAWCFTISGIALMIWIAFH
jgi:hypothetical protein